MSEFLLAIDVGNSRIKFALFDYCDCQSMRMLPRCLQTTTVALNEKIPYEEIRTWSHNSNHSLRAIIASSNTKGLEMVLSSWSATDWPLPTPIDDPARFPLVIQVDEPNKVGIDRLLNAVAANVIRPKDQPAIIIDIGTATTVDYLSSDGDFEGGAILPGFHLFAQSLHHYTALLPLVSINELAKIPYTAEAREPLGRSTRQAIKSGLYWGQLGAIKELIARLESACQNPQSAYLLLTGGAAPLIESNLPDVRHEPHLVQQGLALVYKYFQ